MRRRQHRRPLKGLPSLRGGSGTTGCLPGARQRPVAAEGRAAGGRWRNQHGVDGEEAAKQDRGTRNGEYSRNKTPRRYISAHILIYLYLNRAVDNNSHASILYSTTSTFKTTLPN